MDAHDGIIDALGRDDAFARWLLAAAYGDVCAPPATVTMPEGNRSGRAVLVDAGRWVVAIHVSDRPDRWPSLIDRAPHGAVWLRGPVDACEAVLRLGSGVGGVEVELPRQVQVLFDADASRCAPTTDVAALRASFDAQGPHAMAVDTAAAVVGAHRDVVLGFLLAVLPPDAASLARASLCRRRGILLVSDLVEVQTCACLPNPAWVEQGIARFPALAPLLTRPHSHPHGVHAQVTALSEGVPPRDVLRDVLSDIPRNTAQADAVRDLPAAALASLGQLRDPGRLLRTVDAAWTARVLADRFRGNRRRPLDADEMIRLVGVSRHWHERPLPHGCDLVGAATEGGRLVGLPPHLVDPWRSLRSSIGALRTHIGRDGGQPSDDLVAMAVVFRPGRTPAQLRNLDGAWHAAVPAREDEQASFMTSLIRRRAGRGFVAGLDRFPHFLEDVVVVDGITVEPLRDHASYREHGRVMGHCVATYAERALHGVVMCVALSDADGGRSTASYVVEGDAVVMHEHQGVGNEEPPPLHAGMLDGLEAAVPMGAETAARLWAERRRREEAGVGGSVMDVIDLTDAERADHVAFHFRNLRPWLPARERGLAPRDWLDGILSALGAAPPPVVASPLARILMAPFTMRLDRRRR